jgi:hypothetical protein
MSYCPCNVEEAANSHFVHSEWRDDTGNYHLAFAELSMSTRPFAIRPILGDDNPRIGPKLNGPRLCPSRTSDVRKSCHSLP